MDICSHLFQTLIHFQAHLYPQKIGNTRMKTTMMEYSIPELKIILQWGLRANKTKKPRKEDKELYQKILVDVREIERAEKELTELI